jgi:hypothetical protein
MYVVRAASGDAKRRRESRWNDEFGKFLASKKFLLHEMFAT